VKVRHTQTYANMPLGKEQLMREQLQARLETLKKEFEAGEVELEKVEKQRTYLRETMLRIGGAIQVLEEVLGENQLAEQRSGSDSSETDLGSLQASGGKEAT
jgi:uncharacterized protein with von Willebrand factor type A (vWA) domain